MPAIGLVHHTQQRAGWRLVMIRSGSLWVSGKEIEAGLSMTIVGTETGTGTSVKTATTEGATGIEVTTARPPTPRHNREIMARIYMFLPIILLNTTILGQSPPKVTSASIEEHARDIITKALRDKNPDTRRLAAVALSLGGPREPFFSELEQLMDDKDVEVCLATVSSLCDLKGKRSILLLRKALNHDVPEVSFAAAKALFSLNDPAGKEALLSVLAGESKVASGFLTRQKRDAVRMVHTPKTMFMFALKQSIGFAPLPGLGEGISSMQGVLSDPGVSGRAMAALLMGKEKDKATLEALLDALEDKDASVRAAAVHSLALRNYPALRPSLVPMLDDPSESVRLRAAAGYLRLGLIRKVPVTAKRPGRK